jgi:hypothetical protein
MEAHGVPEGRRTEFETVRSKLARAVQPEPPEATFKTWVSELRREVEAEEQSSEPFDTRIAKIQRLMEKLKRESNPWGKIKERGVAGFGDLSQDANTLLAALVEYGVFIVPVGELEGWLPKYEWPKPRWISNALTVIRGSIVEPSKPPWNFVADVLSYLGVAV